jgi:PAS domain S-box-containing protein
MIGPGGTIVMANPHAEMLFGYGKGELIGQPIGRLVPERSGNQRAADRDRLPAAPEVRPMGHGRDWYGLRKDGSAFPVEIDSSPLRAPQGAYALVSVIDLTARRRAEDDLRASRQELQRLTGRLLEAQEVERRRIARELHDDINQTLAILAVDLDLLVQSPPGSAAGTAERMRELSARVKDLSSSVHDLSHQLHPSKLEHLGLVAAFRGLCKELGEYHGLKVSFAHFDVPERIPEATALCLYRIAQEALRNVIRHGDTDHAAVELGGSPDGICLRVSDEGVGFDPGAVKNGGLGLVSMRERLSLAGGVISIDSRPAGGTRISVRIPCRPAAEGVLSCHQTRRADDIGIVTPNRSTL